MVPAGVSFDEKERLHFVEEKAKINAKYYIDNLLPKLVEDVHALLGNNFVIQQDGAPAHGAMRTQNGLPNIARTSLTRMRARQTDLDPLDYCVWGAMLEEVNKFNSKPKNSS